MSDPYMGGGDFMFQIGPIFIGIVFVLIIGVILVSVSKTLVNGTK